jgi:hypothetical protein
MSLITNRSNTSVCSQALDPLFMDLQDAIDLIGAQNLCLVRFRFWPRLSRWSGWLIHYQLELLYHDWHCCFSLLLQNVRSERASRWRRHRRSG